METRANYAIIGLFTLAVIAAGFGFVYWFSGKDRAGRRVTYEIAFDGSVSGLGRGGAVLFNGLRKGEVTDIRLDKDDPRRVLAVVEVDADTPIKRDTEAQLEVQMLSGVAAIALKGGDPQSPSLAALPVEGRRLKANRSDFQDLLGAGQRIATKVGDFVDRADRLIADNEGSIKRTMENIESFSAVLQKNSDGVNRFLASISEAGDKIATLSTNLDVLVRAIEPEKIRKIIGDVEGFTGTVAANKGEIDQALKDAARLARNLNETQARLDTLVADLANVAKGIDATKIARTVDNADKLATTLGGNAERIDQALKDIASITRSTESFMAVLNDNKFNVDSVLKDAATVARSLTATAPKLEALVTDLGQVAKGIDAAKLARTLDNADRFAAVLGTNSERVDQTLKDVASISRSTDDFMAVLRDNRLNVDAALKDAAAVARSLTATAPKLEALVTDLGQVAKGIDAAKLARTLDNADRFAAVLGTNSERVDQTLKDVASISRSTDDFMAVLRDNRLNVDAALKDAAAVAKSLTTTAPKLEALVTDLGQIAKGIDPVRVARTLENADRFVTVLGDNADRVDQTLKDIASMSRNADEVVATLKANRGQIETLLKDAASLAKQLNEAAPKLDVALAELVRLAQAFDATKVGRLVDNADKFATALGDNAGNLDKIMKDGASITAKIDKAADRFDAVLAAAQSFLGSSGGDGSGNGMKSMFTEISETARRFRETAATFDRRLGEISDGITRFTGSGYRDLQALTTDGRRTLTDIQRAVRSFERNPQQLISGPRSAIPEFRGTR